MKSFSESPTTGIFLLQKQGGIFFSEQSESVSLPVGTQSLDSDSHSGCV